MLSRWLRSPSRLGNVLFKPSLKAPVICRSITGAVNPIPLDNDPADAPGGLHRVALGDKFNNERYTALRKLGYGQYATVWLARDSETQKHVALKILKANCYGSAQHVFELELLQRIASTSLIRTGPGRRHVVELLDNFHHIGPNGDHVCLVFPVLGCHLAAQAARFNKRRIPVRVMKEVARQLLQGLDFLHRECGIIHTDLKPSNILLALDDPDKVIGKYLTETNPSMETASTESLSLPLSESLPTPTITDMTRVNIKIIDFGVSSWIDRHLSDHLQPEHLRAPEVTLGASWSTGVDIWSLGCLVIEFVKGHIAFPGKPSKNGLWTADDDHLAQHIESIGPIPDALLKRGRKSKDFFDDEGNLLRIPVLKRTNLTALMDGTRGVLVRPKDMPKEEVATFVNFLEGMLAIDPDRRKTAAELLNHPWLKLGDNS